MSLDLQAHWRATLANFPDILAAHPFHRAALYQRLVPVVPGLDAQIAALITEPQLAAAVQAGQTGAAELACDLIALECGVDAQISDFDADLYNRQYPEVAQAGLTAIEHYLRHGASEGRLTRGALLRRFSAGQAALDPRKPGCLIALPDLDDTAASRVALSQIRAAASEHNVVVVALRDGALQASVLAHCWGILITDALKEVDLIQPGLLARLRFGVLNSAECYRYLPFLVANDIPFATCLRETPDQLRPAYKASFALLFSDLAVFETPAQQDAWRGIMADVEFDAPSDAIVVPPRKDGLWGRIATLTRQDSGFFRIHTGLMARLNRQRYFVVGGGDYDVPVMFSGAPADAPGRQAEREKIWRYRRGVVWRSRAQAERVLAASDNWLHRNIRLADHGTSPAPAQAPEFSVHLHAYFTEDLAADLVRHSAALAAARRIIVTTDTAEKSAQIAAVFAAQGLAPDIRLVENRGRDILPFLRLFSPGGVGHEAEIWAHIHHKKATASAQRGDIWRSFLLSVLLGDGARLSPALGQIAQPGVGLVGAFEPYRTGWLGSRALLPTVAGRLPGPLPRNPLVFPTGNMFWVRRPVVQAMLEIFGEDYAWPEEPIPDDGTAFHLVERLWPAAAAKAGLTAVFLDKPDQRRA